MIDQYDWRGGREAMLRFGPESGPVVVIALPLFEEANRTRAFVVTMCRALAARGVASALPDLPGQGESSLATEDARLDNWRAAFAAAAASLGSGAHGVALRSGAAIDGEARLAGRWRLSPLPGAAALAELRRAASAVSTARREPVETHSYGAKLLAGHRIAVPLLNALSADRQLDPPHGPVRTVRLATDPQSADRKVDAAPLWRRAEPGNDPALAALLADDIVAWIARCGG
ncbi:hypothetical protein PX554_15100 [Sphingomonas sp. H39-1-10]|uniref:hypothetical protein n=1 Tax=Sphingomonas TaxID=13687 RepID=UPI00088B062E|nr:MULTISPECIES: hypothetical protein [Sphingomonas]MDF0489463.1 hypothetical protein [Sphingomonas pollutisoli]SDA29221.1 hypothetical protein SAMN03159340_02327 [Sphingomonas sp. NFR15]